MVLLKKKPKSSITGTDGKENTRENIDLIREHQKILDAEHKNANDIENLNRRVDKIEDNQKELQSLCSSVAVIANEQKNIKTSIGDIKDKLSSIAEKPAKKWEGFVDKVIFTIVGIIIAYFMSKIGF